MSENDRQEADVQNLASQDKRLKCTHLSHKIVYLVGPSDFRSIGLMVEGGTNHY